MKEYKIEELKKLLSESTRSELRDHAFGDREIYWKHPVLGDFAKGYSGPGAPGLFVYDKDDEGAGYEVSETDEVNISDLFKLGIRGQVERNDSTGPDTYQEGKTMPGLSSEGVLNELT